MQSLDPAADSGSERTHVFVSGASGGLGRALALAYAGPDTLLTLWGRDRTRLEQSAEACRGMGAETRLVAQDLREGEATLHSLRAVCAQAVPALAVLGAGVSSGSLPGGGMEPAADALRTLEINAAAAIGMGAALLELMLSRPGAARPHLVFLSSIAAFYPLPASPAYCASKSALAVYARAVRAALGGRVRVSVIYPGYVDTPMSRRLRGRQPFRWPADKAAAYIRRKLEAGKDEIAFPWPLTWGIRCLNILPDPVARHFAGAFAFTVEPDQDSPLYTGHTGQAESGRRGTP